MGAVRELPCIEYCDDCVKKFDTCNPDEDYCQGKETKMMTLEDAISTGKPFNRKCYKDGWYFYDDDTKKCRHTKDLSTRDFSEDDKNATDWHVKPFSMSR